MTHARAIDALTLEQQVREIDRVGSFAAGDYVSLCRDCERHFIGDKRATQCLRCALASLRSSPDLVFTPEEVVNLNAYQVSSAGHPFTCANRGDGKHEHLNGDLGALFATTRGWVCPFCDYTQNWAHSYMKDGSAVKAHAEMWAHLGIRAPDGEALDIRAIAAALERIRTHSGNVLFNVKQFGENYAMPKDEVVRTFTLLEEISSAALLRSAAQTEGAG